MKILKIIFITGWILICSSCHKSAKEIETDYVKNFIETLPINNDIKWIVIQPGLGCPGCIQEGEQFMKKNVSNKSIYFVLTKIVSLKILSYKVGIDIKKCNNVYADVDNLFILPSNDNIYPCIVKIDNKKIINLEFQNPDNSTAFDNLNSELNAEYK